MVPYKTGAIISYCNVFWCYLYYLCIFWIVWFGNEWCKRPGKI